MPSAYLSIEISSALRGAFTLTLALSTKLEALARQVLKPHRLVTSTVRTCLVTCEPEKVKESRPPWFKPFQIFVGTTSRDT